MHNFVVQQTGQHTVKYCTQCPESFILDFNGFDPSYAVWKRMPYYAHNMSQEISPSLVCGELTVEPELPPEEEPEEPVEEVIE